MTRRRDDHDHEDWARWDWRRPCEVVGADPADPREKARRLAEGTAGLDHQARALALDAIADGLTAYHCAGAGESRVACTTAAQWDAAVGRRAGS
jgi:hypothetical protein